ncbi:hypothetical protein [Anabaena azotica]|uniref:hypothetical protein n=1 Tax=Anabaena azotica TaxID=197653 RepID=UPI0039A64A1D
MIANHDVYITPEQYLALEEKSPVKHEYINGYIYAMADASDPHVTVTGNIIYGSSVLTMLNYFVNP